MAGTPDASGRDEAFAFTGRFTVSPINRPGELVHFGIAASRRTPEAATGADTNTVRFRARPETNVSKARFLTTGKIRSTDYTMYGNAELALMKDAVSLQAEYTQVDVHRLAGLKTASFNGYYVYASYFLTGEKKVWLSDEAEYDRVIPKSSKGAWELAARVSNMNLNDNRDGVGNSGWSGDQLHPWAELAHQSELQVDVRHHVGERTTTMRSRTSCRSRRPCRATSSPSSRRASL